MKNAIDLKEAMMSSPPPPPAASAASLPPLNYAADVYKQYLSYLYQMSARLRSESAINMGAQPASPVMKKGHELWSPAKLVEMESSESEVGSGKRNIQICKYFTKWNNCLFN